MSAQEWAGFFLALMSIAAGFTAWVRWLVKHYLSELKPNSGSSLKDSVIRLEEKVEILYQIMIQRGSK